MSGCHVHRQQQKRGEPSWNVNEGHALGKVKQKDSRSLGSDDVTEQNCHRHDF